VTSLCTIIPVTTTKQVCEQNKVSSQMGRNDSWPATTSAYVLPVLVFTFSFSEAAHMMMHTMYTMKQCRPVTVPTDPFTRPTAKFLSECAKCQPGNTKNGATILPIANLADSEFGNPVSRSSFLVTICVSHLVSEIFACDGQTDRRTTRTITIASLHIVVGQLITQTPKTHRITRMTGSRQMQRPNILPRNLV